VFVGRGGEEHRVPMRRLARQAGQTTAEYAVIVAFIVTVCVVAALFLGTALRERTRGSGASVVVTPAPFTPPVTRDTAAPDRLEECERDGWRNFPQFHSERECEDYVRTLTP
jgi:Flp pilus assembly pilin Flp